MYLLVKTGKTALKLQNFLKYNNNEKYKIKEDMTILSYPLIFRSLYRCYYTFAGI